MNHVSLKAFGSESIQISTGCGEMTTYFVQAAAVAVVVVAVACALLPARAAFSRSLGSDAALARQEAVTGKFVQKMVNRV